nr:methyltransferase domain-containing protein [Clostridiales bacterium]
HFRYEGDWRTVRSVIYLNNIFAVLDRFSGGRVSFPGMVAATASRRHRFPLTKGSFRVRFSRENRFEKVDAGVARQAEKHVTDFSGLRIDRVKPTTELWYIIRSEGVGFYGQLLFKREATEKNLNPGELRPEFCRLMIACAPPERGAVVCDPFCGYGAIPRQLLSGFEVGRVMASDIDRGKVERLRREDWAKSPRLDLRAADALRLEHLQDGAADAVITDPPWGYYEDIGDIAEFYERMLRELLRVTRPGSSLVVLSARKQEFAAACDQLGIGIFRQVDTLVNGKKAAVFVLNRQREAE